MEMVQLYFLISSVKGTNCPLSHAQRMSMEHLNVPAEMSLVLRVKTVSIKELVTHVLLFLDLLACSDSDVRLVGSNKTSEGTVEVCYYNNWGIISDESWGSEEAQVVCRQLGFSNPQSMYLY